MEKKEFRNQMTENQEHEFRKSIAATEEVLEINLKNLSMSQKEFAFSLARKLETIDEDAIKQWKKILNKSED
jgi:hypothetical protein